MTLFLLYCEHNATEREGSFAKYEYIIKFNKSFIRPGKQFYHILADMYVDCETYMIYAYLYLTVIANQQPPLLT